MGIYMNHNRRVTPNNKMPITPSISETSTNSWLSPGRLSTYLTLARGDHGKAMDLYSWNCNLASACARDLGHLEVAVRNSYHNALIVNYPDWLWSYQAQRNSAPSGLVFEDAIHRVPARSERDLNRLNKGALDSLKKARQKAGVRGNHTPSSGIPDGKILANLTFGFWGFLTEPLRANILWNRALGRIPNIPSRSWLHPRMQELGALRNRVAHMEPLAGRSSALKHNLKRIDEVLNVMVEEDALQWISQTSRVPELYAKGVQHGVLEESSSTYLHRSLR